MSVSVFLLLLSSFVSSLSVLLKLHFSRLSFEVACRKEFFSLQGYGDLFGLQRLPFLHLLAICKRFPPLTGLLGLL